MQEELAADLEDDLEKAAATFALVEQATKQQNLNTTGAPDATATGPGGALLPTTNRIASRTLNPLGGADPRQAKDSVLGEVRALSVNHESRLEAIERAEKARQRELESRSGGEFKRELGHFVEEGRLKKSGGVEEVERIRKLREEKTRKEVWERTQARLAAQAEKEAAAAAAAAAGPPPAAEDAAATAANEGINGHGGLEVPQLQQMQTHGGADDITRESSPEPVFVEAKEIVSPTVEGTS
jgi:hypothetical protein